MKIVHDAGHGRNTAGKRVPDDSMREWEFNSAVATLTMKELEQYEGVEQIRVDDVTGNTDVPLGTRTRKANEWKADLYISHHANGFGTGFNSANGIETFVHTTKPKESVELATRIQSELIKATGRTDRGVKFANFQVLREAKMTAILIEYGFMTNLVEANLLKSDSYRKTCAEATVKAIVDYYKLTKKVVKQPTQPQYQTAKVAFEGNEVEALLINGTTMVWSRDLANLLGVPVNFVNGHVVLNHLIIPKEEVTLIDGKSYMHSRKIAEYLGLTVGWDQASKTVNLTKK